MRPETVARAIRPARTLCVAMLLLAGCASPGASGSSSAEVTPSPTEAAASPVAAVPTPSSAVPVTRDVRYASSVPDLVQWSEPLLDVYAPEGASGLPLVVMFPPHGITKDDARAFTQLASAVAEAGAVAVVANWSQLDDPADVFTDAGVLEEMAGLGQSMGGCAVAYAVEHAADFGADPSRLVLLGELYGGNLAGKIALAQPAPFAGCDATAAWDATGLVGWDTDWLATMPSWDELGADAARGVAALSPWPSLGDAPRIPVEIVISDAARAISGRCDERDAAWMVARDPTGAMRTRLDEVGTYSDGCQDLGDAANATAAEMQSLGIPAEVVALTDAATVADAGGHVESLGAADLATLTRTVLKAAGAAPAP